MRKRKVRVRDGRFCVLEVELENGRLSISGEEGRVVNRGQAKKQALDYWTSYFEENKGEIQELNTRFGKKLTSARGAAKFVLETDGELHGLDVFDGGSANNPKCYIIESCGQIREELAEWFPEVRPYLKYHLNDMHAGCEHQDQLGWGRGYDVALSKNELTPVQRAVLEADAKATAATKQKEELGKLFVQMKGSGLTRQKVFNQIKAPGQEMTIHDGQLLHLLACSPTDFQVRGYRERVEDLIAKQHPALPIESQVFKDSIGAPCPTCGYKYGSAWLKRELPIEVFTWFESLDKEAA